MLKKIAITLALASSFGIGFAFNAIISKTTKEHKGMKRVTAIGGIFFKTKDPQKTRDWYKEHLGLDMSPYGSKFNWRHDDDSTKKGYTLWTPFSQTTKYFEPSNQDFMVNYHVENIEAVVEALKKEGVTIVDEIATYDYGKFVHILDLDGNKIELFEPKGE
jgi:catechol 2,3-dioxygenase-like lactoylglutathione lyase family enzyme